MEGEAFVREIAESLWKEHGPRILAAAMVLLLDRQRRIAWRSCLSGRLNFVPVLLEDPLGIQIRSRGELMQLLRRALSEAQLQTLGRIALTTRGFAVDLPPAEAAALQRSPALKAAAVKAVFLASLPPVCKDQQFARRRGFAEQGRSKARFGPMHRGRRKARPATSPRARR